MKMKHLRILEEIHRTTWAMTLPSFRAMLGALEEHISQEDYVRFHSLREETKADTFDVFGRALDGSHYATVNNNVGFLMVDGPITPRATWFTDASGLTSLDVLTSDFKALEENPSIDTIVHLFDSPGGAVKGFSDYNAVVKASKKKTISYAWMAASLAYGIASASKQIIVPPDGVVGSVGVVATIRDYKAADEKRGIRNIEIVSTQSPKKRPDPATPEGRDQIQEMVDETADMFIGTIAENYGITKEYVQENFGKGGTFLAHKAAEAGMVDKIQTSDDFVKSIVKAESSYSIQTISAVSADETNTEDPTMDVNQLQAEHKDVYAEIVTSAKAEEVERLKAIEGIKVKFAKSNDFVRAAAVKAVDDHRFDEGATVATVQDHVLNAVSGAQDKAIEEHATPRREAAEVALEISEATPKETKNPDPNAADDSRIDGMLAASKADGRIK